MPGGAPARPIPIEELFFPGVYQEILDAVEEVAGPMARAEAEMREDPEAHADGDVSFRAGTPRVSKQAKSQPEWARECIWDTSDPEDCITMQPHGIDCNLLTQKARSRPSSASGESGSAGRMWR